MADFWIPQYKYQYVEWLQRNYPHTIEGKTINWNAKSLEQLRAIYCSYRREKAISLKRQSEQMEFAFN